MTTILCFVVVILTSFAISAQSNNSLKELEQILKNLAAQTAPKNQAKSFPYLPHYSRINLQQNGPDREDDRSYDSQQSMEFYHQLDNVRIQKQLEDDLQQALNFESNRICKTTGRCGCSGGRCGRGVVDRTVADMERLLKVLNKDSNQQDNRNVQSDEDSRLKYDDRRGRHRIRQQRHRNQRQQYEDRQQDNKIQQYNERSQTQNDRVQEYGDRRERQDDIRSRNYNRVQRQNDRRQRQDDRRQRQEEHRQKYEERRERHGYGRPKYNHRVQTKNGRGQRQENEDRRHSQEYNDGRQDYDERRQKEEQDSRDEQNDRRQEHKPQKQEYNDNDDDNTDQISTRNYKNSDFDIVILEVPESDELQNRANDIKIVDIRESGIKDLLQQRQKSYDKEDQEEQRVGNLNLEDFVAYYEKIKQEMTNGLSKYIKGSGDDMYLEPLLPYQKKQIEYLKNSQAKRPLADDDLKVKIVQLLFGTLSNIKILPHSKDGQTIYMPQRVVNAIPSFNRRNALRSHKRLFPLTFYQKQRQRLNNLVPRNIILKHSWRRNNQQQQQQNYGVPFNLQVKGLGQVN